MTENSTVCDVCREDFSPDGAPGFGVLEAKLPDQAGERLDGYRIVLCGPCTSRVISGLSRERMLAVLFDESEDASFSRDQFGKV